MRLFPSNRLRIIALPQQPMNNAPGQDWAAVLAMDASVGLTQAPQTLITIERIASAEVSKLGPHIDARTDGSECLAFSINLDRNTILAYLNHARRSMRTMDGLSETDQRARGIVFAGELFRDFERKVFMIIIAAHLANPTRVSLSWVISQNVGGGLTSESFKIPFVASDRAQTFDLQSYAAKDVFAFIENRPADIEGVPQSQFMKGLSYLSHRFRQDTGASMVNLVWSLAAIEALISGEASEKANIGVIEARLRALIGTGLSGELIGAFRDLYKYRNALFHGNVAVPFSFDDRNMFGFGGVKHSNTMPFKFSLFSYSLAVKILQRFFELGKHDVRYELTVSSS